MWGAAPWAPEDERLRHHHRGGVFSTRPLAAGCWGRGGPRTTCSWLLLFHVSVSPDASHPPAPFESSACAGRSGIVHPDARLWVLSTPIGVRPEGRVGAGGGAGTGAD